MLFEFRKLIAPTAVAFLTLWLGAANAQVSVRVAEDDDAEENIGPGSMEALDSSDLELGVESVPSGDEGIQLAGMRFLGIDIPVGSIINSASIQFTVDEDDKGPAAANFVIFGELSPNPSTYTSAAMNISDRPRTAASVNWLDVPSWTGQIGSAGPDQLTPDLSTIIQELIDQPGWAAGNAMAFGIAPVDPGTGDFDFASEANRTAESWNGDPGGAPLLQIDFQVPEPSSMALVFLGLVSLLGIRRRR